MCGLVGNATRSAGIVPDSSPTGALCLVYFAAKALAGLELALEKSEDDGHDEHEPHYDTGAHGDPALLKASEQSGNGGGKKQRDANQRRVDEQPDDRSRDRAPENDCGTHVRA